MSGEPARWFRQVDVEATTAIRQAAVLAGLACRDRTLRCRSGLMALSVTVSRQIA